MPALTNQRHELFAQGLVEGLPQSRAYIAAGYETSGNAAESAAARLFRNVQVQARVSELRAPALANLDVTVERVLQEYARIAFADMRHFASVNKDGIALKDSDDWSDDDAAAVAELGETTSKDGGSVRFKLHSKTAALDALAKYLRMFGEGDQDSGAKHLHLHGLNESQLRALADGFSA